MRSDKKLNICLELHGISTIYISVFMPLKNTSAFPWNLIEIVSSVKVWKRGVGLENANFNKFKSEKLLRSCAYWKVNIFSSWPIQIAKHSDQSENSVFVNMGN